MASNDRRVHRLPCSGTAVIEGPLGGAALLTERRKKTQNKHSDEILKVIDELLLKAKLKINDIQNICVCVGPGSFTGVRVAMSIVKGLAIGVKAKVFACSNFDIFNCLEKDYYLVLD